VISLWADRHVVTHWWAESARITSNLLSRVNWAIVSGLAWLRIGRSLIAEVALRASPARVGLIHTSGLVTEGTSWALVILDLSGFFAGTVVTDGALPELVVVDTSRVAVVADGAVKTLLRACHTLEVVVGTLVAGDRSEGSLWAEVTLRADPHHTVVLDTVVA
jgi:hypothetical protein